MLTLTEWPCADICKVNASSRLRGQYTAPRKRSNPTAGEKAPPAAGFERAVIAVGGRGEDEVLGTQQAAL